MQPSSLRLKQRIQNGVLPAMATPLLADGYNIDVNAVGVLVDFLINAGIDGLFVGGTTGEGLLLDTRQRCLLHETAVDTVRGRIPVLVHVGANTTRETVQLTEHAATIAVDGIVCITPTFFGMPDVDLLAFFRQIAALTPETAFLVYDIPHMAATGVSPQLLKQLVQQVPNFAGVKCSRPDAQHIRQLIDSADDAMVLAGNERIALGSLALGATGLISGLATAVPEPFVALCRAVTAGNLAQAQQEQRRINQLLDRIPASHRIGALKRILQQRGIAAGPMVPPRQLADDADLWQDLLLLL